MNINKNRLSESINNIFNIMYENNKISIEITIKVDSVKHFRKFKLKKP